MANSFFSSGLIGAMGRGAPAAPATPGAASAPPALDAGWERDHAAALDNVGVRKGLKVFWFATGSEDRLMTTTLGTLDLFKRNGFSPTFTESAGGHTWANWRDYLHTFVPQLFH